MTNNPLFYIVPGLIGMFGVLFFAAGVGDIVNYGGGPAAWAYALVGVLALVVSGGLALFASGAAKS